MQAILGAFFPQASPQPPPPQDISRQRPKRPSPLLQFPLPLLQRILHLGGLRSADILALAATCHGLRRCAPLAYHSLHFPLDASTGTLWGMRALLRTLQLLMQTIYSGRAHPAQIRRITLFAARARRPHATPPDAVDPDDPFALPGGDPVLLTHTLRDADLVLAQLLALSLHLRTFVLDASAVGRTLAFPATLAVLAHDRARTFAELALVRVCTGTFALAPLVPGSLRARRVTVRSEDTHLVRTFLSAPVGLRALDFRESVASTDPWAILFNGGLHHEDRTREVESLVLTCGGRNPDFEDHTAFIRDILNDTWTSLTTLSISAFAKARDGLPPLTGHGCPLRRLRLTVNVDDQFIPEFDQEFVPHLVYGILVCFPDLEELVFDHMRATLFAYALHEQCLTEWAMAIRNSRCLRVLALSSLFVLEPKDNASEYADAGTILSDVEMDIAMDEEMNEGLESGLLISQVEAGNAVDLRSPEEFMDDLATFADHFFDRHLRSECLSELRFLYDDPESECTASVGFRPQKLEAPEVCGSVEKREYAAVPVQTAYELFWEPAWRQRPEDYTGYLMQPQEDNEYAG